MGRARIPARGVAAFAWAALLGVAGAVATERLSPAAHASVERGSEGGFRARGLDSREFLPPLMTPARWMGPESRFEFRNLPEGPARLVVAVRKHLHPVQVSADGVIVGSVAPRVERAELPVRVRLDGRVSVTLRTETFRAGSGRRLGALVDAVAVEVEPGWLPRPAVLLMFVAAALAAALGAMIARAGGGALIVACALVPAAQVLLLLPEGLLRSAYAVELSVLLGLTGVAAGWLARRFAAAGVEPGASYVGFLALLLVQGAMALHPMVIGLDGVFHAHVLTDVARGDMRPVSLTQHTPPFRFPYGISFQLLLVPFARAGFPPEAVTEGGAVAAALLGSVAFARLVAARAPALAPGALFFLATLPWTFLVYSNGNYSNVFAQAATVAFLAWWAGNAASGALVGGTLLALACLSHLSGLIVASAFAVALAMAHGGTNAGGRARLGAVVLGLTVAAAYYASFAGLVAEQLPRALDAGSGGPAQWIGALWRQVGAAASGWGVPAILLGSVGFRRAFLTAFRRDLLMLWAAGAVLLLLAVATPIEVRYLYALTPLVAIAAAAGFAELAQHRGVSRVLAAGLALAQAGVSLAGIARAILSDWRA